MSPICQASQVRAVLSFISQQAAVSNIVVMQFPTILDTVNMMNDNREIQLNRWPSSKGSFLNYVDKTRYLGTGKVNGMQTFPEKK